MPAFTFNSKNKPPTTSSKPSFSFGKREEAPEVAREEGHNEYPTPEECQEQGEVPATTEQSPPMSKPFAFGACSGNAGATTKKTFSFKKNNTDDPQQQQQPPPPESQHVDPATAGATMAEGADDPKDDDGAHDKAAQEDAGGDNNSSRVAVAAAGGYGSYVQSKVARHQRRMAAKKEASASAPWFSAKDPKPHDDEDANQRMTKNDEVTPQHIDEVDQSNNQVAEEFGKFSYSRRVEEKTVVLDISNDTDVVELLESDKTLKGCAVTLRLTNSSNLTILPGMNTLPEYVHFVEFDESCECITGVDETADGFLKQSKGLREVDLSGLTQLRHFGNRFLAGCGHLESVTFPPADSNAPLDEVTIGVYFLALSTALKSLDLSYFSQLQAIPDFFLASMSALRELTFPPMPRLAAIGDRILESCSMLKRLTFTALPPTTTVDASSPTLCCIGDRVFSHCTKLEAIDLRPLFKEPNKVEETKLEGRPSSPILTVGNQLCFGCTKLRSFHFPDSTPVVVGSSFMYECSSLTDVSIEFFRHNGATSLPDYFLWGCSSITELDFSALAVVNAMGRSAFCRCSSLKRIEFPPSCRFTIGEWFLTECESIESIDLCCCAPNTTIPRGFLDKCKSLKTIDLSPIAHVTAVGPRFMSGCVSLKTVHLPFTSALTSIGLGMLGNCTSLETLTVSPELHAAKSITTLGGYFLADCHALHTIDLHFLGGLAKIDECFLMDCKSLKILDTTPLPQVTGVGEGFLLGCTSLEEVDLHFLRGVTQLEDAFLSKCNSLHTIHNLKSGLSSVTTVKSFFMFGSAALKEFDFSCLAQVVQIGDYFLATCEQLQAADISTWTAIKSIGMAFLGRNFALASFTPPAHTPSELKVDEGLLMECSSLKRVDFRFLANAKTHHLLLDCTSKHMTAVVVPEKIAPFVPESLKQCIVECGVSDEGLGGVPHLQWSWKQHGRHPKAVQLAVVWLFSGLQYQHTDGSSRCLPGEVAYEICRFIGSPVDELLHEGIARKAFGFGTDGTKWGKRYRVHAGFKAYSTATPYKFKK